MSQRKLTRQLGLLEGPEGPPQAPSLTSPVSPVDQPRGQWGCSLFRRMRMNRSIQERQRSCHSVGRYKFTPYSRLLRCVRISCFGRAFGTSDQVFPPWKNTSKLLVAPCSAGFSWMRSGGKWQIRNGLNVVITCSRRKIKWD